MTNPRNYQPTSALNANVELVIFDLFGTLIQSGVMHHPFRQLLKWAKENGRQPKADDARRLMTLNADIPELAAALGICAPDVLIEQLKKDVREELKSLVKMSARNLKCIACRLCKISRPTRGDASFSKLIALERALLSFLATLCFAIAKL